MRSVVAVLGLSLLGCGKAAPEATDKEATDKKAKPADCGPGLLLAANAPVATLNGKSILCSELFARDKTVVNAMEAAYRKKLQEVHAVTLAELIDDRLLEEAAKAEGLTVETYVGSAVTAVPATDEEVKSFYEQAVASGEKLPPLKETKDKLAAFITENRQKEALKTFRAGLREKAAIKLLLDTQHPKNSEP